MRNRSFIKNGLLVVGEFSYGCDCVKIESYKGSRGKVIFGKYCSVGPNVKFVTGGNHPIDRISSYPFRIKLGIKGKYQDGFPSTKGDIVIGNDVWIGSNAMILSGVTIGNGAVIAANSMIVQDVPDYAVIAGNPARVVKYRLSKDKITRLLAVEWWNWPHSKVAKNIDLLNGINVDSCLEKLESIANEKL